jgi:hypothetical protein
LLAHGNVAQVACKVDRVVLNAMYFIGFAEADPPLRMTTAAISLARE